MTNTENNNIYIPIGEDCFSTIYLRDNNMRHFSTIFDWIVLTPSTILNLFKTDFKDLLLKQNLRFIKNSTRRFKSAKLEVMDTKHNIFIPHFFNDIDNDYNNIYEKFNKRINRLNNILLENDNVFFVYKPTRESEIISFPTDIHNKFGKNKMLSIEKELKNVIKQKYDCDVIFIYL